MVVVALVFGNLLLSHSIDHSTCSVHDSIGARFERLEDEYYILRIESPMTAAKGCFSFSVCAFLFLFSMLSSTEFVDMTV